MGEQMGGQHGGDDGIRQPSTEDGASPQDVGHCEPPDFVKNHPPDKQTVPCGPEPQPPGPRPGVGG